MLRTSGQTRKTPDDRQGPCTSTAAWSEILRWESLAWIVIGAAWVVSAWPGLLVAWDGLTAAVVLGLGVLAGFVVWQVVAHGARIGPPANWVGYRWRAARPGRRAKTRRLLAVTVILDAVAWSVTGIGWMVAARVFDWSETLTGAPIQVAFGVAFLGWGLLHIRAARRVAASDDDLVVVSRRVLGSGPPTLDDETGRLTAKALRTKQRRVRRMQQWVLNPPMRITVRLTSAGKEGSKAHNDKPLAATVAARALTVGHAPVGSNPRKPLEGVRLCVPSSSIPALPPCLTADCRTVTGPVPQVALDGSAPCATRRATNGTGFSAALAKSLVETLEIAGAGSALPVD